MELSERCVVSREKLEQLASEMSIIVQHPDNPNSYCGLAVQYFMNTGVFSPDDDILAHVLIPKDNPTVYLVPHDDKGQAYGSNHSGKFLRSIGKSHKDYLGMTVDVPPSEQDLRGEKREYVSRARD